MERQTTNRCSLPRMLILLQILLGSLIVLVGLTTLHHLYSATTTLPTAEACQKFNTITEGFVDFDLKSLSDRITDVLSRLSDLQDKLESKLDNITKSKKNNTGITRSEFRRFLDEDVVQPLYAAHIALRLIRIPKPAAAAGGSDREDPLINFFTVEEIRKYITGKPNRGGQFSVYGTNKTYGAIGHACVLMRAELEEYMDYDVGSYCRDDWHLAEKLMLGGCDPLPRRRCLARAPKLFQRPHPISKSLWSLPDDSNVRWSHYTCKSYKCLLPANPRRGFSKCASCFDMGKEKLRWVTNATKAEFLISDVLAVKPGEVRIGLDVSVSTGSFAARMREKGVTVVSTAMNLGAPFSETIALRGVVPIYSTLSQRLPFFDNTMDLIHTSEFLSGWVDMQLLDFVLFDWDRVLRPGGLLWVDRFHCSRKELDDYMYMFLQFRYKKHKWVVSFRSKEEVYLSALLEKPPRSL